MLGACVFVDDGPYFFAASRKTFAWPGPRGTCGTGPFLLGATSTISGPLLGVLATMPPPSEHPEAATAKMTSPGETRLIRDRGFSWFGIDR